uniref:Putative secreted protein n=1 Tax=Panstrongylus lignarius TaxID=156445 RepID=A0A224Y4X4_9HEMI
MKFILCTTYSVVWSVIISICWSDRIIFESEEHTTTSANELDTRMMMVVPVRPCPPGTRRLARDGSCRRIRFSGDSALVFGN